MRTSGPLTDYANYAVSASATRLRPLSPNEILAYAQFLYRTHGLEILKRSITPSAYLYVAVVFIFSFVIPRSGENQFGRGTQDQVFEFLIVMVLGLLVSIPLITIGLAMICTLTTEIARRWLHNSPLDWAEIDASTQSMFWEGWKGLTFAMFTAFRWVVLGLVVTAGAGLASVWLGESSWIPGVIATIGVIGVIVAIGLCIWELTRVIFTVPVYLIEGKTGKVSVARSRELIKPVKIADPGSPIGSGLSTLILVSIILYIGYGTIEALFQLSDKVAGLVSVPIIQIMIRSGIALLPGLLAVLTTLPYFAMIIALSYFERRARKEGYDIELLIQQMSRRRR